MTGLSVLARLPELRCQPATFGDDGKAALSEMLAEHDSAAAAVDRPAAETRRLCDLGTGEQMEVLAFRALPGREEAFERIVQRLSFELHAMETGVSDVRVMHPRCGEATIVITLLSRAEADRFDSQLQPRMVAALAGVSEAGGPVYANRGSLMPQAHSLGSLLTLLTEQLRDTCRAQHDVRGIGRELARWFPRRDEYSKYVTLDASDPSNYTRNVLVSTPGMEVLLMCWPAGARSTIHCHDESSCWVVAVEGEVHEVQFDLPLLDKKFARKAKEDPHGAISGKCGPLRAIQVRSLGSVSAGAPAEGEVEQIPGKQTYANNEIGIHRIENRSGRPAITMHVYAPRLRRMKIFRDTGDVSVVTVTSDEGTATVEKVGDWEAADILDVAKWNAH
jgi:cysteine dioxygenase